MANLATSLEQEASRLGEPIEAAVLGEHYCEEDWDRPPERKGAPLGAVLDWGTARPWLDEDYDNDFGGADCRPFYAWTASWVFFVYEYDGSTALVAVPRHPRAEPVDFGGLAHHSFRVQNPPPAK